MATSGESLSGDGKRLAELGYKQELRSGWSGFSGVGPASPTSG